MSVQVKEEVKPAISQDAALELLEACEFAAGYARWCVTSNSHGCYPTPRQRNERWRVVQRRLDAAVARATGEAK